MARRVYSVTFEKVSVSAVQDLFFFKGGTGVVAFLKGIEFAAVDATPIANQSMALRISQNLTATAGSGGGAATPRPNALGDPAATFTARINDTTGATGTKTTVYETGFMTLAGYANEFEDFRFPIVPSNGMSVELITAPAAAVVLSGTATIVEVG